MNHQLTLVGLADLLQSMHTRLPPPPPIHTYLLLLALLPSPSLRVPHLH